MGGSNSSSLLFLIAAAAMFYVLVIRPQQKRAKQQASMLSALEPGVEIVTIGGIYGTIVDSGDERLLIRVADGSELEIARRAVSSVITPVEAETADELDTTDDADDSGATAAEDSSTDDAGKADQ